MERLDRKKWDLHLACSHGEFARQAASRNVTLHYLSMPSLRSLPRLSWVRTAYSLALGIKADILYANTARGALYASPAALLSGRPFIWHMRDFSFVESGSPIAFLDRPLKRLVSCCASRVVANSLSVARELPNANDVAVIHNGIDFSSLTVDACPETARQTLGLPLGVPIVGMLGRLRPWKGQETFIRIAAAVHRTNKEAHFLVAGGDPFQVNDGYAERLHRTVEELSLSEQITFTGQLQDVSNALAAMDIFVHPGEPEPFGLVNLEAMAMSKPIVAFAHGALPELVEDGNTGILVPPADTEACSEVLVELLRDPKRIVEMGKAGRERVANMFDIEKTVRAVEFQLQHQRVAAEA